MKAVGIVFVYDRERGPPEVMAKEFSEYFPFVSEKLVTSKILNLAELKNIMDSKLIYWGGITESFDEILGDSSVLGGVAIKVFEQYSNIKVEDELKILQFDGKESPWNYTIALCVLFK